MRIHFMRSGGFAGLSTSADIDSDRLPPDEAQTLQEEVAQANFFELPSRIPARAIGVDRFQYAITIQDGSEVHTVEVGEADMPGALQPLVQHLSRLARARR